MTSSDPVLSALLAALQASPHKDLHRALADRYRELGQSEEAVHFYSLVLAEEPANIDVLSKAAEMAEAAGQKEKSLGWSTLVKALSGTVGAPSSRESSIQKNPARSRSDDSDSHPHLSLIQP